MVSLVKINCYEIKMIALASVKEQIFLAQVKCNSLSQKNKSKNSTSCNQRIKKLKRRIRWLNSYFIDSFLVTRSDGSKVRKLKVIHYKSGKTGPASKKYVTTCKRRKFRLPKKIHKGPYYAPSSLLPPQADTKDGSMTKPDNRKPGGKTPSAYTQSENRKHHSRINELIPELRKHCQQVPLVHSRWMIMSKRKMCFVPNSLAIFDYGDVKPARSGTTSHTSVLGFKCSKGECSFGWAKMYPKQTYSSFSIRQLSIDLGQYFAYKRLGISNPKPPIPPGFKLIKVKTQMTAHSRNKYSLWKKTRTALAKSCTNVFFGAGPKQRVVGHKGSVADFFIPLSRHI